LGFPLNSVVVFLRCSADGRRGFQLPYRETSFSWQFKFLGLSFSSSPRRRDERNQSTFDRLTFRFIIFSTVLRPVPLLRVDPRLPSRIYMTGLVFEVCVLVFTPSFIAHPTPFKLALRQFPLRQNLGLLFFGR